MAVASILAAAVLVLAGPARTAQASNARSTDQVMFEWSTNGGYPVRIQCGWFSAGSDGFAVTPGLRTSSNPSYVFRACGRRPSTGAVWCTGWW